MREIDQLKGVAILSVIGMHLNSSLSAILWPAVPIFIILAAYNNVNSYRRRGSWSLRLRRLLPLYLFALLIEILIIGNFPGWLFVLTGGYGPGSYFVPVLMQILIALPVLYWIGERSIPAMLIAAFTLSMICEYTNLSPAAYRLCGLRYLFAAALGVWLSFGIDRRYLVAGIAASLAYLYNPLPLQWVPQNAPAFFVPLGLVVLGLNIWANSVLAFIGKHSYEIFLSQMILFWIIPSKLLL